MGAVAAQRDKAVKLHLSVIPLHSGHFIDIVLLDDAHIAIRLTAGAQNGAAERKKSREIIGLHHVIGAVNQSLVAVVDADKFDVHQVERGICHPSDRGVKTGTVPAACQNSDSAFCHSQLPPGKIMK